MKKGNLKRKLLQRLDNYFTARQLPAIAGGVFLPFLISCVRADGGTYNDLHKFFEFAPTITGGEWLTDSESEFFNYWWKAGGRRPLKQPGRPPHRRGGEVQNLIP